MMTYWSPQSLLLVIVYITITYAENDWNLETTSFEFNITHVLFQSILYCGSSIICDKSFLSIFDIPNQSDSNTPRCGTCSCNETCLSPYSYENCCPDVFFRHGLRECRDVKVLLNGTHFKEVIGSCPVGTNFNLSTECTKERSKVDILLHPPVTSAITKISYINKYCASCNNASLLEEWNVNIECEKETDFNFLSSYQEIIDLAIIQSCRIIYISPISARNCSKKSDEKIGSCNVTGSWLFYDKQIEQACLSQYDVTIGIFRNIFCAMCNPPKFEERLVINQCENSTSIYKKACSFQPILEASFPYKNFFCFVCNQGDNNTQYYTDVDFKSAFEFYDENSENPFQSTISFDYSDAHIKQYVNEVLRKPTLGNTLPIKENLYRKNYLLKCPTRFDFQSSPIGPPGVRSDLHSPPIPSFSFKKPSSSMIRVPKINITSVLITSFAFSSLGACKPESLPNYTITLQKSCSCNVGCREDCCDDFAFTQPWTCIDDQFNRDEDDQGKDYLAIGGCIWDQSVEHFCTDGNVSQFYQAFPVTKGFRETYVNLFCYLCNKKTPDGIHISENLTQELYVWPLEADCNTYINYRNFQSLQELIYHFNSSSCVLRFSPPYDTEKCSDFCHQGQYNSIQSCNISGTWTTFNEDIKNACELTEVFRFPMIEVGNIYYKNKFCSICNPFPELSIDGPCRDVPKNSSVARACQEFPDIKVCSPYKNVFCEMCSNNGAVSECYREVAVTTGLPPPTSPPTPVPPEEIGTFRSTFTLAAYNTPDTYQEKYITCQQNQVLDEIQHTCRNLTCFPGKILINDTCVSLLALTSHLRYTLAMKIEVHTFGIVNVTVKELMEYMRDQIMFMMINSLDTYVYIEDIILMSLTSCTSVIADLNEMFVYLKVFFPDTVHRDKMEKTLINLTESSAKWNLIVKALPSGNSSVLNIKVSRSQQSLFLPSFLWKLDKEVHCFVLANELKHGPALYRNVFVSPLLTCPQMILRDKEFGINWKKIRIEYTFSEFSLSSHQFGSSEGGGIRVCAKDIPSYTNALRSVVVKNDSLTLTIVTLICIIISLLCLLITFITYCIFPILRTLPGINNMCLVVSLFLAQFLMIVRPSFSSTGLAIVSALSHFSWLSMFLWLQVCSFHMYRVFSAKSRSEFNGNQNRKIVMQYIFYAFGSSLFFVTINIFVTLIVTKGENTGYDNVSTLMTYKLAFIITLITPLCFVCVTNVIFYILTAYKIHSTPSIESTTGNRVHFAVYVKLFSLTGLSWILQIIDTFVAFSVLSYFVAILNGLQGFFIFMSYVCNQRVWKLYKKKLCKFPVYSPKSSITSKTYTTSM
ncbi:uncharacterized protein LOC133188090 [Saccostrea echinata]|uniref:uncharacterized protein LOC133188090 n=1 Tax=Saccostrea echinata TaxID=191078 RepID=UPI002A8282BA|nr:uncharacterized protein LOC133188090 [Saccostrea echinata]